MDVTLNFVTGGYGPGDVFFWAQGKTDQGTEQPPEYDGTIVIDWTCIELRR